MACKSSGSRAAFCLLNALSAWLGSSAWSRGEDVEKQPSRPLASYVPLGDLVAYAEFQGLDAHAAGYSKTTASWLLNEKKGLASVREAIRSTLALAFLATAAEGNPKPSELIAAGEALLRAGCACGVIQANDTDGVVVVVRGGAKGPIRKLFDQHLKQDEKHHTAQRGTRTLDEWGGAGGNLLSWFEGDDLVVVDQNREGFADAVIATIERRASSAVDHPTRRRLSVTEDYEAVAFGFVDVERLMSLATADAHEIPANGGLERTRPTSITVIDGGKPAALAPRRSARLAQIGAPPVFTPPNPGPAGVAPAPFPTPTPPPGLRLANPLTNDEPVPRPPGMNPDMPSQASVDALRQQLMMVRALGLDGVKRAEFRWGFDGRSLASTVRVVAPSPRRGVLALFGGPTLNPRDLPKMPAIAHNFVAFALDVKQVEAKVRDLVRATDPEVLKNLDEAVTQASVRDDVEHARRAFEQVGPRVVLYSSTPLLHEMKSSVTKSMDVGSLIKPGTHSLGFKLDLNSTWHPVVFVETRDAETLRAELPAMIAAAQKGVATMLAGQVDAELPLAIKELKNPYAGYEIRLAKLLELAADQKMRAVVVTGPRAAALAGTRRDANDALRASESKIEPLIPSKPLTAALERLPSRLLALSVEDSVDGTLSEMNAWLSDDDEADEPDEGDAPRPAPAPAITPDEWRDRFVPIVDAAWADDDGLVIENRSMLPSPWPLALILLGL